MTDKPLEGEGPKPDSAKPKERPDDWERGVLERLAFAALNEQRKARRWGIFFKLFFVIYLVVVLVLAQSAQLGGKPLAARYTALVDLEGVIDTESPANADNVITGLRSAFESKATVGVILRANSPGGSPVQSAYIYDEIKRLRQKNPKIPLYAVIRDVCASGCYYAVAAADKIYADRSSIVGSIGVLMDGFGFVGTMEKLGVERRLLTAGENKGILDPFSPMKARDRQHAQHLLNQVHQQFISRVRDGRGEVLKETKDTFSGLFWTGEDAQKHGLVDEFGSAGYVAREIIGAEEIVDFTFHEGFFDRFTRRLGTTIAETLGARLLTGAPSLR